MNIQNKDNKMKTLLQPTQQTLSFSLRKPSYAEAQQILKGNVFTMKEYYSFRKSHPQYNLPACPNAYYKEWVSSYEFLGLPAKSHGEYLKDYWAKVKAGEIVHKGRSYAKVKTTSAVKKAKPTTEFEDKQAFINLAKKLGIYEQFKPAFRTLFTYDELLDLVTM